MTKSPARQVIDLLAILDLDRMSAAELDQLERAFRRLAPVVPRKREKLANGTSGVLAELGGVRGCE